MLNNGLVLGILLLWNIRRMLRGVKGFANSNLSVKTNNTKKTNLGAPRPSLSEKQCTSSFATATLKTPAFEKRSKSFSGNVTSCEEEPDLVFKDSFQHSSFQ